MSIEQVIELFIRENMPEIKIPENMAKYFVADLKVRGLYEDSNTTTLPVSFNYGDGQTARVRKEIISGDLKVPKGAVLIKNGDKYQTPKGPGEMYDIPANQVEGNGEFFEFPDADGNYKTLASIIKMIPTPSLDLD